MPPTTRSEQKAATRRRILEVAAQHFAARGYAATSLNDLSTALGLTKGTIFFHFTSKAELARAISEDVADQWVPLHAAHEERGTRGLVALVESSRQVAHLYRESAVFRAASRLRLEAENIDAELPVPFVGWIDLARTYLAQAQADGELVEGVDVDETAWHVVAWFAGVQEVSTHLSHLDDLTSRVEGMWRILLRAVARDPEAVLGTSGR
ncbi:ScbR family autoregulator-binding transcription factor [Cellulosimicrobium protaetiae]|uniref:TetR family transcriptional regulator n=1 Tax=Cellulosimicrobium protaetiae TaxID=2587808 RepID=A0A6M5UH06_9MICO|nr:ScbR family autoregulator-binding transcription factor [Cellulosimicrobium protaetiae]QJW35929.1 TetR family transcriptional regulator [Cellulosimicrobium protaetiae]